MSIYTSARNAITSIPFFCHIWESCSYYIKRRKNSEIHDIISWEEYQESHPEEFKKIVSSSHEFVSCIKFIGEDNANYTSKTELQPIHLWKTKNATIIGESNVVIDSTGLAIFNHVTGKNYNYTDPAIYCGKSIYQLGSKRRINFSPICNMRTIDYGISMVHTYSWNYFHFIIEILPKFKIIQQANIPREIPLVFDSNVKKVPQFLEFIEIFNIEKREIIYIDKLEWVRFDTAFLITPIHRFPLELIDHRKQQLDTIAYHSSLILYIRRFVATHIDTASQGTDTSDKNKKIFLSRKSGTRRPYNESDVWNVIKNLGYKSVDTATMSIKEQVIMFSEAKHIIAASGAALTNIIFCKPGTKVLVLYSLRDCSNLFSSLAAILNIDLQFFIGIPKDSKDIHTSFTIPAENFREGVEQWDHSS